MNYEEMEELERNVKIKKEANDIYKAFLSNISLKASEYIGGKFRLWHDGYNAVYVKSGGKCMVFQCRFLHEAYSIDITPSAIFSAIKADYSGVHHLKHYAFRSQPNDK